ncbi:MAG: hypothetical protein RMJ66_07900 [Bacteroidia bacterium]|nr:hypothetical protein [Bacteroidia bacterium]
MVVELVLWAQLMWEVPTAAGETASDLRLFSAYQQDAWIGYKANRRGQIHIFLHHIDTSGYERLGRNGICISCQDTASSLKWDAAVGEKGWIYVAWTTSKNTHVSALTPEGLFAWKFSLQEPAQQITLLPHPEGGVVLLSTNQRGLVLQGWNAVGKPLFEHILVPPHKPLRKAYLISSNIEGFLVLWESFTGDKWEITVQKWRWNGTNDGPAKVISSLAQSVEAIEFIGDGYGGLLGVYESVSLNGSGKDLRLIRYSRNGSRLYELPLCTEVGDQQNPRLYKRGTDLLVVWEDNRKQDWDLYYQRIDISTGSPLLPPAGQPLVSLPSPQRSPHLVLDYFQNELIAAWIDYRHLQADLYMQRFSSEGKPLWEFIGRPLATGGYQQRELQVTPEGFHFFWVAYLEDVPHEGTYPWVALVSLQGEIVFRKRLTGNTLHPYARFSDLRAQVWDKELLLLWSDDRDSAGRPQFYLQKVSPSLETQWLSQGMPVSPQKGLAQKEIQTYLQGDTVWLLWRGEESDVESDLFAQAILRSGSRLLKTSPFVVCGADRVQHEAKWVPHSSRLYAIWTDTRSMEETGFDLYLRCIQPPAPEVGWRAQSHLQNSAFVFSIPENDKLHFLWQEEIGGTYQILYAHNSLEAVPHHPTPLAPTGKAQRFLKAICSSAGILYAAFCEEAPGPYEQTIRIFAIGPNGNILWRSRSPFPHKHHLYPQLTLLRDGDILLTALAYTSGWELVYARYTPKGEIREKGILLSPISEHTTWQVLEQEREFWLLINMQSKYLLYQGSELSRLKPLPFPGQPAEALLLSWQGKVWLFWTNSTREKLLLSPILAKP